MNALTFLKSKFVKLYWAIYSLDNFYIFNIIILLLLGWISIVCLNANRVKQKGWKVLNIIMLLMMLLLVIMVTLLMREKGNVSIGVISISDYLSLYDAIHGFLLNFLLFLPLGLFGYNCIIIGRKWICVSLLAFLFTGFSIALEIL